MAHTAETTREASRLFNELSHIKAMQGKIKNSKASIDLRVHAPKDHGYSCLDLEEIEAKSILGIRQKDVEMKLLKLGFDPE